MHEIVLNYQGVINDSNKQIAHYFRFMAAICCSNFFLQDLAVKS